MTVSSVESWTPASRRRRWLSVYVDYLLLGAPIAVILWAISGLLPGIRTIWLPLQILLFLLIEALLLKSVRWSPGQRALGIETFRAPWEPIEPGDPKGVPVVNPWLLRNERWWTILPGILMVLDGAKLLVRWTEWSRTMPFFGVLLEGGAAAAFQVGLGLLEIAAGVALLRLRRWAAWAGAAYAAVILTSFTTSGPVIPEYVEREAMARRTAQGREVREEEIRFLRGFVPAATVATGVISLLWMGAIASRIRTASRDRKPEGIDAGRQSPDPFSAPDDAGGARY
ncbi:MAG TPA: hypothetical protein VFP58_09860 [Candidatus Eisenbacteria bacterium]|nr:hypothetical protein [Candidatus Eisenbacteria bacterium]